MTQVMKANESVLAMANEKTSLLFENKTQIRIGGGDYEKSYYLFLIDGTIFIGSTTSDGLLPKFFAKRPEYEMVDNEGKLIAKMQQFKNKG
jgi:hypothetical protein